MSREIHFTVMAVDYAATEKLGFGPKLQTLQRSEFSAQCLFNQGTGNLQVNGW